MIPDIAHAMDYVKELHPRDLPKLMENIEDLTSNIEEYKFRKTIITIDTNRNRFWIESPEYGYYTYAFSSPGMPFKDFLAGLNKHYILGKLGIKEVFDNRASFAAIRKIINEVDLSAEKEFKDKIQADLHHMQGICDSKNEFISMIIDLNGCRNKYHYLNDDSIQSSLEDIFLEPWQCICTKESVTARKLWKDFQKLQNKLKEEVVV